LPQSTPGSRITSLSEFATRLSQAGSLGFRTAVDVFNGRPFGPNRPMPPSVSVQDETGGPRSNQYRTSANLVIRPRLEYPELTPFEQIRNLSRLYDVASICIDKQIKQLTSLDWNIVARDKKQQKAFEESGLIQAVTDWWKYPDRDNMYTDWLTILLRNVQEIDALTLYPMRNQRGQLRGLKNIDGTLIKPLINDLGEVLAYQQIIHGLPAGNYIKYGVDSLSEVLPIEFPAYHTNDFPQEMIYRPRNPRPDLPYGIAPAEFVIMRVNTALRKQTFDLSYFTDGNVPEMLIAPPDGNMQIDQVVAFEQQFNEVLQGNDAMRRKAKFLAWPANVQLLKQFQYDTALDEWMMKITCAAYGVTPAEMGFTDDVNKATGESQEDVQYRAGIKPLAKWLGELFNRIIQEPRGMNCPGLEWQWQYAETSDQLKTAQEFAIYLDRGVASPDEVRSLRFGGDLEGSSPGGAGLAPTANKAPATSKPEQQEPQTNVVDMLERKKAMKGTSEVQTGVMIAFMLPPEAADLLAWKRPDAEKPEDLHITLAYLGDTTKLEYSEKAMLDCLSRFVSQVAPVSGNVNGYGRFAGEHGVSPVYANFDAPGLPDFRQKLVTYLAYDGIEVVSNHGYTPHITLAYIPQNDPTPTLNIPDLNITFGEVVLAWGNNRTAIPLVARC